MKTKIQVAVSTTFVNKKEIEINLPEENKYYSSMDDGNFFPRGLILFAILPRYKNDSKYYTVLQIERNKQKYDDFKPSSDCSTESWIKYDQGVRGLAFKILTEKYGEFDEISERDFYEKRELLLNEWKQNLVES